MTVNTTNITSGPYAGNGLVDTYAYTFRISDEDQLIVYETDDKGAVTELVLNTGYTVTGVGNNSGGTIVRTAGNLPSGYTWYIRANYELTQETAFASQGGFFPQVHERSFDKLTFIVQQLNDRILRAFRFSDSYSGTAQTNIPEPVAGAYVRWNNAGDALINDSDISVIINISGAVAAVAAIDAEVVAVAGNATNINTVAGSITNVNTVAGSIANVNTVAGSIANVNTVAGSIANVNTVAGISGEVSVVAGISIPVQVVAAIDAEVIAVAGNATNVNTVAGSIANVNTVAGSIANVNTVAGINADVTAVAGNATNINAVAGNATNINAVAGNATNINTVAGNTSNINTAATNIAAIIDAPAAATTATTQAGIATTKASEAAASAALAEAIALGVASGRPDIRPSLLLDFANSKTLDPRITFTRASASGGYYDGVTFVKAEENLFQYSQDFSNRGTSAATFTLGQTAPDGSTSACLITHDAQFEQFRPYNVSFPAGTYTLSFWAKRESGTNPLSQFYFNGDYVSLGDISPTNEWVRYSFTFTTATPIGDVELLQDRNTSGFGGVYLWGIQLEQRSSVTAYTATTTQPITRYQPKLLTAAAGVPVFDHDPVTGESLGLRVEGSRTNLLTYSEDFSSAVWPSVSNVGPVNNAAIAPDGSMTAAILEVGAGATALFARSLVCPASTVTYSLFIKKRRGSSFSFAMYNLTTNADIFGSAFNFDTGIFSPGVGSPAAEVKNVGNGWYRLCITNASGITPGDSVSVYAGFSGGPATQYDSFYIWGAQLEAGAAASSYIKTEGSQVTRAADSATMTGDNFSSWYRQDEGTFYIECASEELASGRAFAVSDNTYNNRISSYFAAATHLRAVSSSGLNLDLDAGAHAAGEYGKCAVSYKTADYAVSLNGGAATTSSSNYAPPVVDRMFIGSDAVGDNPLNGYIKKLAYYPKRLPDAVLQAMTQ